MYTKVFVPVDDSQASLLALQEACKIAKQFGAIVHVVHVVDLAQFSWGGTGYMQSAEVHNASKEAGEKVLAKAKEVTSEYGVSVEFSILESAGDKIATLLATEVKASKSDLVVMGTHGWTGVMHMLMGSVAEGVLRQVNVPLMLVRKRGEA